MVVQHNLQAMNSNRMLNITNNGLAKSTEKLASGYRINRAADDAAGLAISEKMRKQIRGLEQASANAQDGISCVQTAEGALAEVEDMLQRMNQLTVQAANGTNSVSDRQNIQDEIDQLVTEIDRIAETSKFNETYLLKGATDNSVQTLGQYTYKEYIAATFAWDKDLNNLNAASAVDTGAVLYYASEEDALAGSTTRGDFLDSDANLGDYMRISEDGVLEFTSTIYARTADGKVYEVTDPSTVAKVTYTDETQATIPETDLPITGIKLAEGAVNKYFILNEDGTRKYITNANIEEYLQLEDDDNNPLTDPVVMLKDDAHIKYVNTQGVVTPVDNMMATSGDIGVLSYDQPMLYTVEGKRVSANGLYDIMKQDNPNEKLFLKTGDSLSKIGVNEKELEQYLKIEEESYPDSLELMFQVGSDGTVQNKLKIEIESMNSVNLGVDILKSDKNSIVDEDGQLATDAIEVIANAINKVSAQRAALGAVQNRLEHTINNLDNVAENTTAAESSIRDTDMATEMVKYSNTNILAQAGQSMLAQANQANQGVLSLLGQ